MRARGDVAGAIAALRAALRLDPERDDLAGDLAIAAVGAGRTTRRSPRRRAGRARSARSAAPASPRRRAGGGRAGDRGARDHRRAAGARPDVPEVQRAARALGVPLPLDGFRVDGRAIIRAFEAAAVAYTAPAVLVLDRAVMRVFATGTVMTLTHQIVRVDSKDAVDKWAEIAVPGGAEILSIRTHKRDGSTREPEEIAGKETISAPDVAIGDYIEWEYLETRPPSAAFAPGFLVDRFFFQSFDAPMARSELLLVSPSGVEMQLDPRAGAPRPQIRVAADGTRVTSFVASGVPQLFAERAAVPAIRIRALGARVLRRDLAALGALPRRKNSTTHYRVARAARAGAPSPREGPRRSRRQRALAAAMVDWVTENIEATDELADPASFALARGRGSRTAPPWRWPMAGASGPPGADALAPGRRCGRGDAAAGAG
jgi:hypothetical protein